MSGQGGAREAAVEVVVREAELPSGVGGLDDELARELMTHYLESAGGRVEEVRAATAAARARPGDAAALDRLRGVLHKIAGSAGTYGFPGLTASARALEKQALAARDAPPAPAALLDGVAAFEGEMLRAFAAAREAMGHLAPGPAAKALDEPAAAIAVEPAAAVTVAILGQRDAARAAEALLSAAGVRVVAGEGGAEGAILVGGGAEALVEAGRFLCEGKPLVAVASSGGTAATLAGRAFGAAEVGSAETAEDAAAELLLRLAARAR